MEFNKIIHYCWFGNKKKPLKIKRCIKSWSKFFPDYKIIEWNESNFNVDICEYVQVAYKKKKWAFVSDYCRFYVLFNYGGMYFDTDVMVLKRFDQTISFPFLAIEKSDSFEINPGLCCAFYKGDVFCKNMLAQYENESFSLKTICSRSTEYFVNNGYVRKDKNQIINGYNIYSSEYFCPIDYRDYSCHITPNTCCKHLYLASWAPTKAKIKIFLLKIKSLFVKR